MNKRQHKKKVKYIIDNIQKVNLQENDVLIFRYDDNKYNLNSVSIFADAIKDQISKKILFVPKDWDMIKASEN